MVYGTIPEIRRLTGKIAIREHDVSLSPNKGDGSTTEFIIPNVGNNKSFICDKDASTTSTITTADITVYVNGVSVTVSSIDEEKGSVTLDSAPANGAFVTADYTWSEVSDQMVIDKMNIVKLMLDKTLRGSNIGSQSYTQVEWGDGETKTFLLHHFDVTSVDTVTVNGVSKTEDTHYYLIKHDRTNLIKEIVFDTAPIKDEKNISIAYTYGDNNYINDRVANLLAARLLLLDMPLDQKTGRYRKGFTNQNATNMDIEIDLSRLELITRELGELRPYVDKRVKTTW